MTEQNTTEKVLADNIRQQIIKLNRLLFDAAFNGLIVKMEIEDRPGPLDKAPGISVAVEIFKVM